MKQPPRFTRRSLVAVLAARGAVGAKAQQQPAAARPDRVRDAAASVRARPVPRNIPPSFRFIPY